MKGHQKKRKNKKSNAVHLSWNMVVIIYCYIGSKDKVTTWYLNGFPEYMIVSGINAVPREGG